MSSNPLGARSGPPGRRRGRAPKPLPPPTPEAPGQQGGVPLTAADLLVLAEKAGLPAMRGRNLGAQATKLREALHDYVLWRRVEKARATPGELLDWAASLGRWAADGAIVLGGPAVTYLRGGVPLEEEGGRLATLRHHLREAGVLGDGIPGGVAEYDAAIRALVGQMRVGLAALGILADGLAARTPPAEAGRPPDRERGTLFRALAEVFEAITGEPFTADNLPGHATPGSKRYRDDGNNRDNRPTGPALEWVRALFGLTAERAAKLPPGADRHPEFRELADWANKRTDAPAERIKLARKATRRARRGVRGKSGRKFR